MCFFLFFLLLLLLIFFFFFVLFHLKRALARSFLFVHFFSCLFVLPYRTRITITFWLNDTCRNACNLTRETVLILSKKDDEHCLSRGKVEQSSFKIDFRPAQKQLSVYWLFLSSSSSFFSVQADSKNDVKRNLCEIHCEAENAREKDLDKATVSHLKSL